MRFPLWEEQSDLDSQCEKVNVNIKGNTILFHLLTVYYKFTFNKCVKETTTYTLIFVCLLSLTLFHVATLVVLVALVGHLGQQNLLCNA